MSWQYLYLALAVVVIPNYCHVFTFWYFHGPLRDAQTHVWLCDAELGFCEVTPTPPVPRARSVTGLGELLPLLLKPGVMTFARHGNGRLSSEFAPPFGCTAADQ